MNILFLTLSRINNISQRGIYPDLLRVFIERGHKVYIVSPVERRFGKKTILVENKDYSILNIRTLNIQKTNIVEKGLGTLLLEHQFYFAINKFYGNIKFDLVLYSTPPITLTKVIQKIKQKYQSKTYLLLKDIFPQNAVDLGMMSKSGLLYKSFRKKERKLYQLSDYIGCMSPANVEFVLKHNPGIDAETVEVCPNSIELDKESRVIDKTKTREQYCIPKESTLFIYGGNLGKPQGLDFLLNVLKSNKNKSDRFFLIAGSGTEYSKISQWFEENQPSNAQLISFLPKQEYDELVRSCDVGLIFLDPRFTIPNYPSRLLSYLENKMPVLLATDLNTDIGKIAQENGYGLWCENGDLQTFNALLNQFVLNPEAAKQMGEKGYQYLLDNYQAHISADIILSHFAQNSSLG